MAVHWLKPLPFDIHCIVAADSRFKGFEHKLLPNQDIYHTINVIERGARVNYLEDCIVHELSNIPRSDIAIIYTCVGINELTFKEYNPGGIGGSSP